MDAKPGVPGPTLTEVASAPDNSGKITAKDVWLKNLELGVENQHGAREVVKSNTEGIRKLFRRSVEVSRAVGQKIQEAALLTKQTIQKGSEIAAPYVDTAAQAGKETIAVTNSLLSESQGRGLLIDFARQSAADTKEKIWLRMQEIPGAIGDARDRAVDFTQEKIRQLSEAARDRLVRKPAARAKVIGSKCRDGAISGGLFVKGVAYDAPKAAIGEVTHAAQVKSMEAAYAVADRNAEINFRAADWSHRLAFNTMRQGHSFIDGMKARAQDVRAAVYDSTALRYRENRAFRALERHKIAVGKWEAAEEGERSNVDRLSRKVTPKAERAVEKRYDYEMARLNSVDMHNRADALRTRAAQLRGLQRVPLTRPS
jgi:hypothetical protein